MEANRLQAQKRSTYFVENVDLLMTCVVFSAKQRAAAVCFCVML